MTPRPALPALTAARFFAALWVVVYHLWRWDVWDAPAPLQNIVAAGPVAVTFFFVLSGFILVYAYADDQGTLRTTPRSFYRARFARIYPVYVLGLLIALPVVLTLWKKDGAAPDAFAFEMTRGGAAFLLVQSWHPSWALAWNPPAWSIAVEAVFYALFPLVLRPLFRATAARLGGMMVGLWLLSLLPSVLYLALLPDGLSEVDHQSHAFWIDALKYHPLARLPELLFGACVGVLFVATRPTVKLRGAWVASVMVVIIVASGVVPHVLLHNGLLAPLFAVVIVSLCAVRSAPRLFTVLGESSYSLYILHVPLLFWAVGIGQRRWGVDNILGRPVLAAAVLVVTIGISVVVFRLFESPLRRWLRGQPDG